MFAGCFVSIIHVHVLPVVCTPSASGVIYQHIMKDLYILRCEPGKNMNDVRHLTVSDSFNEAPCAHTHRRSNSKTYYNSHDHNGCHGCDSGLCDPVIHHWEPGTVHCIDLPGDEEARVNYSQPTMSN